MKIFNQLTVFTSGKGFIAACIGFAGLLGSATAGILVTENYSEGAGFTPGYVQSTYGGMSGTYTGSPVSGDDATLYEIFTPGSDYDLVSLEFRYEIDALGTSPTLNFNVYEIPALPASPADNMVLGSALLGAGLDYTPLALTNGSDVNNMAVAFTEGDILSLTSGTSYAIAITASDMEWNMARRGGGNEAGGYGYKNLVPLHSSGRALMVSFYDSAVIPEPSSLILVVAGIVGMGLFRKRRR
ncbi:PEP-CTERM sorting domain-containing protein [Kiritimatiellota bacterium B12222]|nr:PEP-CTERM sorting domain-containing protein [Kiritimatiellota bacterium B12222]